MRVAQLERQLAAAHDARDAQHASAVATDDLAEKLAAECGALSSHLQAATAECTRLRARLSGADAAREGSSRQAEELRRSFEGLERRCLGCRIRV